MNPKPQFIIKTGELAVKVINSVRYVIVPVGQATKFGTRAKAWYNLMRLKIEDGQIVPEK